jgi:hypothetical protein
MYMGSDGYQEPDEQSPAYKDGLNSPFNVDALRSMLAANDFGATLEEPFMSREECEQKSREISAADVIFAHGMGIDLTQ